MALSAASSCGCGAAATAEGGAGTAGGGAAPPEVARPPEVAVPAEERPKTFRRLERDQSEEERIKGGAAAAAADDAPAGSPASDEGVGEPLITPNTGSAIKDFARLEMDRQEELRIKGGLTPG